MTERELRQLMTQHEGLVDFKTGIEDLRVIARSEERRVGEEC